MKYTLYTLLILFCCSIYSCKKCETCSYSDSEGNLRRLGQVCGSKDVLDDYEKECNEKAEFFETTCTCENE